MVGYPPLDFPRDATYNYCAVAIFAARPRQYWNDDEVRNGMRSDVADQERFERRTGVIHFWACFRGSMAALLVTVTIHTIALADAQRGTVVLTVLDQSGAPVPFAGLYYSDVERGVTNLTSADPSGKYIAYSADSPFEVCGYAPLHPNQVGCLGPINFAGGGTFNTDLPLKAPSPGTPDQPTGTIVLTIHDPSGKPVPYAEIPFNYGEFVSKNYADAQGRRIITGPVDKPAIICARAPAGAVTPLAGCIGPITVVPGATAVVDLQIRPSSLANGAADPTPAHGWIVARVLLNGSQTPVPGGVVKIINTSLTSGQITGPSYVFPSLSTVGGINGGSIYAVTLAPPSGYAVTGVATQQVTIQPNQGVAADFFVQSSFAPFWVQSFTPEVTEWSGPDDHAIPFGLRPQWSSFLVVARQDGARLLVLDPETTNYAWIDAVSVGPSGPPTS